MKYLAAAVATAVLSMNAFAGEPGNAVMLPSGVALVAPQTIGVWSLGVEALYMYPSGDDFHYIQVETPTGTNAANFNDRYVERPQQFGGTVDLTYLIPGYGRDVKLSFTNLQFMNSEHFIGNTTAGQQMNPPSDELDPLTGSSSVARGKQSDQYASADFLFGQWHRINSRLDSHLFMGLRYLNLNSSVYGSYFESTTSDTQSLKATSNFEGLGPRVGAESALHLGWGISVVGRLGTGLLVGHMDGKTETVNPNNTTSSITTRNDNETRIIPEADARIGVDYMFNFTDTSSASIQLGYEMVNYFDAVNLDYVDTSTPNTVNNNENFNYYGPYLRFQVNLA
jgi:hypothetical protein